MTCILLTGASRGIGAAAKRALEARGARVVGQATKADSTDMVAADFCEPGAPQELWQTALARAGGSIDVLVNNAGLFDPSPLDRSDMVPDCVAGATKGISYSSSVGRSASHGEVPITW